MKFWEIERVNYATLLTRKQVRYEEYFTSTYRRESSGRFVVKLPFHNEKILGKSKGVATKRLYALERKLQRNTELGRQYTDIQQKNVNI